MIIPKKVGHKRQIAFCAFHNRCIVAKYLIIYRPVFLLFFARPNHSTVKFPNGGITGPTATKKLVKFPICSAPSEFPVIIIPAILFASFDYPTFIKSSLTLSNLLTTLCIKED